MIKRIINKFVATVQKAVIYVSLFVFYIFGFGITLLFAAVFNRELLGIDKYREGTFWKKAEGYENDIAGCERES